MAQRPLLLLFLLFFGYTSLSLARRALQDVFTAMPNSPGNKLDASQLGIILSSQTVGYTITKLISGMLVDQLNPSAVFVYTLWSASGSLFLMALSSNHYCWLVMYTINGLALGVGWPAVAKILRTSVPSTELATWWGVLSAAINVAGALGPWLTMSVLSVATVWLGAGAWRSTFIAVGMCCFLCGNIFALHRFGFKLPRLRYPIPAKVDMNNLSSTAIQNQASGSTTTVRRRILPQTSQADELFVAGNADCTATESVSDDKQRQSRSIFIQFRTLFNKMSPTNRLLLCCSALLHLSSTFLRFAISNWFPLMLRQYQELYSIQTTNLFVSVFEVGGIFGNLLAGALSDLGVSRRPSCFLNPRIPFILSQMVIASLLLCRMGLTVAAGISRGLLMTSALLLGLCVFGAVSLCGVLAVELAPISLSGTSHALTALCANVGAFMACYPISRISDIYGWADAFVFSSLFCAFTLIPMCLLNNSRVRRLLVR